MPQSTTQSDGREIHRTTRVMALRLPPSDIAALNAFARGIGCSAGQVLKLAGQALVDGRVAIGADEVKIFEAVVLELRLARAGVERLAAKLDLSDGIHGSALDDAFVKLLAALAAFETSARLFADRRQSMARKVVTRAARRDFETGVGGS